MLGHTRVGSHISVVLRGCAGAVRVRTLALLRVVGHSIVPTVDTCSGTLYSIVGGGGSVHISDDIRDRLLDHLATTGGRLFDLTSSLGVTITSSRERDSVLRGTARCRSVVLGLVDSVEGCTSSTRDMMPGGC